MSALQGEEKEECGARVCAEVVGNPCREVQNHCAISALTTAADAVVVAGDGMEVEEVVDGECEAMEECAGGYGGGGGGVRV